MTNFKKILLGALCASLVAAAPAGAASTTAGLDQTTTDACTANSLYVSNTNDYLVPFNGVITKVSTRRGLAGGTWRAAAVRANGGGEIIAALSQELPTPNGLSVANVRMPVQAADRLAIWAKDAQTCLSDVGALPNSIKTYAGITNPAIGTPLAGPGLNNNVKPGLQATIETDADGDGFGDDTQDGCPTQAATAGACIPSPPACKVPSLKGKTKSAAKSALEKANCKLGSTKKKKLKKFTKKQKKNRVRTQSVKAGTTLANGATVTITINVKKS